MREGLGDGDVNGGLDFELLEAVQSAPLNVAPIVGLGDADDRIEADDPAGELDLLLFDFMLLLAVGCCSCADPASRETGFQGKGGFFARSSNRFGMFGVFSQGAQFGFQQFGSAGLDKVHLRHIDAEGFGHPGQGPFAKHVKIVDLVVLGLDALFHAMERKAQDVLLPFSLPERFDAGGHGQG